MMPFLLAPKASGGGGSTITFYWGSDGSTWSDAQYSVGSATGTVTGSFTTSTSTVKIGTKAAYNSGSGGFISFPYSNNFNRDEGCMGGWHYHVSANNYNGIFRMSNGTDSFYVIEMANDVRWIYGPSGGGGTIDRTTTQNAMIVGTWYWWEMRWSKSSNTYSFNMWDSSGTLILSDSATTSTGTWSAAFTQFDIGDVFSSGGLVYHDNFMVSSSPTDDLYSLRNNTSLP